MNLLDHQSESKQNTNIFCKIMQNLNIKSEVVLFSFQNAKYKEENLASFHAKLEQKSVDNAARDIAADNTAASDNWTKKLTEDCEPNKAMTLFQRACAEGKQASYKSASIAPRF